METITAADLFIPNIEFTIDKPAFQVWVYEEGCPEIALHKKIAQGLSLAEAEKLCKNSNSVATIKYIEATLQGKMYPFVKFYIREEFEFTYLVFAEKDGIRRLYRVMYSKNLAEKLVESLSELLSKMIGWKVFIEMRDDRDARGELPCADFLYNVDNGGDYGYESDSSDDPTGDIYGSI